MLYFADNSNLFRFPLKVRVIGSRLYVTYVNRFFSQVRAAHQQADPPCGYVFCVCVPPYSAYVLM